MRIRLVIPAALLLAAAYVKGRQDAVPVARPLTPPACDLSEEARLRAEAEAADILELTGERIAEPAGAEVAATVAPPPAAARESLPITPDAWAIPEFTIRPGRPGARPAPPAPAPEVTAAHDAGPTVAEPAVTVRETDGPDLAGLAEWAATPAPPLASGTRPTRRVADADAATLSEWATHVVGAGETAPPVVEARIDESGRFSLGGWAAQAGHMAFCGITFRDRRDRPVDPGHIRLLPDALANVAENGLVVLGDPGFAPDREGFTLLVAAAGPGSFAATGRYELVAA